MKRLLFLLAGLLGAATLAGDLRDNVGVGLGTIACESKEGLISHVCAATTNGIYGNQTFAITSGTSGAKPWHGLVRREALQRFIADNMDVLAREIAMGRGEHLDALTELLAVPAVRQAAFRRQLQASFDRIYSSGAVTHLDVLAAVSAFAAV